MLDWTVHIGIAVLIGVIIVNFVIQRTIVDGPSMEPTLQNGDSLWVEKVTSKFGRFHVGDIVTINVPKELRDLVPQEHNPIIKRIIAVSGDKVEIKDGKVYINDKVKDEPYLKGNITQAGVKPEYSNLVVPEGYIYVLGDNRGNSTDSRILGPIKKSWVIGRAVFRLFPLKHIGFVN